MNQRPTSSQKYVTSAGVAKRTATSRRYLVVSTNTALIFKRTDNLDTAIAEQRRLYNKGTRMIDIIDLVTEKLIGHNGWEPYPEVKK